MANLFKQAARIEQREFFTRLDYQWGRGLKQRTKSDHCPLRSYNPAEPKVMATVTALPRTHEVKPSCEHGALGPVKQVVRDMIPNSGLHFVRGFVEQSSPCTLPVIGNADEVVERAPRRIVCVKGVWTTEWL